MKKRFSIFAIAIAITAITQAATNDLTGMLQKGLFEEEANRNLDAAISNYQSLANAFDKDRQVAATAIFRLGECYRKLGRTNEAVAQYQRIVHDFSDQQTLVILSQQNLVGLGASAQLATQPQSSAVSEQARELELVKKLQAMPLSEVLQAGPTLLTDATLINLIYQYNQTELDLVRLRTDHAEGHPEVAKEKAIQSALQDKIKERLEGIARALSPELGTAQTSSEKANAVIQALMQQRQAEELAGSTSAQAPITDEEEKEIRRIQELIRNSPDLINSPSAGENNRWTPLYQAAREGWLRVATYLLDHGANVNKDSGLQEGTPLHAATQSGNKGMAELLLSRGADVNAKTQGLSYSSLGRGILAETPLHIAADMGFLAVAETLLDHKADVNARSDDGLTPLHLAASNGRVEVIKLLLARGADINAEDKADTTPLITAIHGSRANGPVAVGVLLDAKADVNSVDGSGQTPLGIAAWNGYGKLVEDLLDAHADPNRGTNSLPLAGVANFDGYTDVDRTNLCKRLLQAGADPNKVASFRQGQGPVYSASPIQLAVTRGRTDVVKILLDYKADANATAIWASNPGMTLLMDASYKANTEIAKALLAHGGKVNARDGLGETALSYAIWKGSPEMVELLLNNKADVNVQDNRGKTPLDMAKEMQQRSSQSAASTSAGDIVALLRRHGALDELPNFSVIRVTRQGMPHSVVFEQSSNGWNQVTLFDLLGVQYQIIRTYTSVRKDGVSHQYSYDSQNNSLPYPDLARLVIHRPSKGGSASKDLKIDLSHSLGSGDCASDVPLQFGDVVEIPEADHVMGALWTGLETNELFNLGKCLTRHLQITVKGRTSNITLAPQFTTQSLPLRGPGGFELGQPVSYEYQLLMLWPVLLDSNLLLASSDLSRIKVTRRNPATGQTHEWIVNCSNPKSPPNFWLRDGDLIEVPEKTGE